MKGRLFMNKFWLGILVLVLIAFGLILVVGKFSSRQEGAVSEPVAEGSEAGAEEKIEQEIKPAEEPEPVEQIKKPAAAAPRPARADEDDFGFEVVEDVRAQQLYQMAETESKIAHKPMMSYKRMVDYCREIIREFPTSPYADKARELLRQMPERHRKLHKVTDEEMGL